MWSWLTVVCTIVVTIILGGGRFRSKLGLATDFSPYIDLPVDIDRGEMGWGWWSSEARQRRLLATRSAATCRNYGPYLPYTTYRRESRDIR